MARRGGIGPRGRQVLTEQASGTYTGTRRIEQERERIREGRETPYPTTSLAYIKWEPGNNHPPDESSRVSAFKFIPVTEKGYGNMYGTIFVRFHKYETPWKYTDVPLTTYESFFSSPSKGVFINDVLNKYPYGRVSGDEYSTYFQDM